MVALAAQCELVGGPSDGHLTPAFSPHAPGQRIVAAGATYVVTEIVFCQFAPVVNPETGLKSLHVARHKALHLPLYEHTFRRRPAP